MKSLIEVTKNYKCAIYNDLSHITPYYLNPDFDMNLDNEIRYHKRNLYLLSLSFEKILINTDNIAAFTRFTTKAVITSVVKSDWFIRFLEEGIIVLLGWGAEFNNDLMYNQIEYSKRYKPLLKEKKYLDELVAIGKSTQIIIREPLYGEKEHMPFLLNKVPFLEGVYNEGEVNFIADLIQQTQDEYGFIGTMEMFPFIDDLFKTDPNKSSAFYYNYFRSWQEYSTIFYSPAITVDTGRNSIPTRFRKFDNNRKIITALYSPDFFERFLCLKIGEKKVNKILGVKPDRLIKIRNGDWSVFIEKYHICLQTTSEINWLILKANKSDLLNDKAFLDTIIKQLFTVLDKEIDFSSVGGLLDTALSILIGVPVMSPFFKAFRTKFNKKIRDLVDNKLFNEFDPFLRKLSIMLADPTAIQ